MTNPNLDFIDPTTLREPIPRKVVLPQAIDAAITGTAVPTPGLALETLLSSIDRPAGQTVRITASSWLGGLPRFRPQNIIERSSTPWIAGLGDTDPSVTLSWTGLRAVGAISLGLSPEASRPTEVVVSGVAGSRRVAVPRQGGVLTFPPLVTNSLTVRFVGATKGVTAVPISGIPLPLPVGLSSISVPALDSVRPVAVPPATPVALGCGSGPTVTVDGTAVSTSVTGTVGNLVNLQPMALRACTLGGLGLAAGMHVVSFPAGSPFLVTGLLAQNLAVHTPSPPVTTTALDLGGSAARSAHATSWTATHRTLAVGAGAATYVQVAQNFNSGWVATLDGQVLTPVRLDGWQQGWLLPAGAAGTMTMTFTPDHGYRAALLIGGLLLVLLFLLASVGAGSSSLAWRGPEEVTAPMGAGARRRAGRRSAWGGGWPWRSSPCWPWPDGGGVRPWRWWPGRPSPQPGSWWPGIRARCPVPIRGRSVLRPRRPRWWPCAQCSARWWSAGADAWMTRREHSHRGPVHEGTGAPGEEARLNAPSARRRTQAGAG